jgi:glycerate kinase
MTDLVPYFEPDTTQPASHIINSQSSPGKTPNELITVAKMMEHRVVALCGYKWVPTEDFVGEPTCAACLNIAEHISDDNQPPLW